MNYRVRIGTVLTAAWRWRHSLFWKIAPMMIAASSSVAFALIAVATVREDARLRSALAPSELRHELERTLLQSMPLPEQTERFQAWCTHSMPVLAERMAARPMADRSGERNENGFSTALRSGRLAVSLKTAGGHSCDFASDQAAVVPALRQQMQALSNPAPGSGDGRIVEQADGWISVTTVATQGKDGAALTIGIYALSPFAKLMQPRSVYQSLGQFLIVVNVLTALLLVSLLIRRIKRADAAAQAWTSGALAARINDRGRDEFSRLTQKFDTMADAMSGVIQVEQALAAAQERNRLARDLHDSAKQRAFALNLQLSAARNVIMDDTREAQLVDAALALTGQLQQDLDSVIRRLAAPTIAESGLRQVMTQGVEQMLAGSRIVWTLSLEPEDETVLADLPEVSRQLFLITMEAVANVLKHSGATRCEIAGERAGAYYHWRITDDGTGLAADESRPQGMGLANMKLRADTLPDASFAIAAGETGGTAILLTFRIANTDC